MNDILKGLLLVVNLINGFFLLIKNVRGNKKK